MGGWRSPAPPIATSQPDGTGDEDCTNNGLPALVGQPPTNVQGTPGVATNNTDAILGIVNPAGARSRS